MNKILRFRLWDTEKRIYIKENANNSAVLTRLMFDGNTHFLSTVHKVELFTGFHDKMGHEIYDADIVLSDSGRRWQVSYDSDEGRWILTNVSEKGEVAHLISHKSKKLTVCPLCSFNHLP